MSRPTKFFTASTLIDYSPSVNLRVLTRTLAAGVENLQLIGNSAIDGTGNAGNNVLTGCQ